MTSMTPQPAPPVQQARAARPLIVLLLALFLVVPAVSSVLSDRAAAVETPGGGVFVPLSPSRIACAATWTGCTGNMTAGETRSFQVLGVGGVPSSGVSAVVLDLGAHGTTATSSSYLTAWASGAMRPVVSSLYYNSENVPRSNTAIVPVGSNGKISIYAYAGVTSVTADIQGYFTTSSTASSTGGFVALHTPKRVANTNSGSTAPGTTNGSTPIPTAPIPVGGSLDIQVTGNGDIPTSNVTAVFANVEALGTAVGQLRIGPGNTTLPAISQMDYGDNGRYDSGLSVKLNTSGRMRITNASGSPVNIKVDVQGYFSGDPSVGGSFTPLTPTNVYSTSGGVQLQGKETRAVKIAGVGGLPAAGTLGSAVLTVSVKNWTAGGTVTVFSNDQSWPGTTSVGFNYGEGEPANGISSTTISRVSSNGYVALYNTSPNPVSVTLTTQGWFSPSSLSRTPDEDESTIRGSVAGASSLKSTDFIAYLLPNGDSLEASTLHEGFAPFVLGEAAVRTKGNEYSVVIDPSTVPAAYIDDGGFVTINIDYMDEASGLQGSISRSAQLIDHAEAPQAIFAARSWAAPEEIETRTATSTVQEPVGPSVVEELDLELPNDEYSTDEANDSEDASTPAPEGVDISAAPVVAPLARSAARNPTIIEMETGRAYCSGQAIGMQVCMAVVKRNTGIKNLIGTTYPVDGSWGWITFDGKRSHTYTTMKNEGVQLGVDGSIGGTNIAGNIVANYTRAWKSTDQKSIKTSFKLETPDEHFKIAKKSLAVYGTIHTALVRVVIFKGARYSAVDQLVVTKHGNGGTAAVNTGPRPNWTNCDRLNAHFKVSYGSASGKSYSYDKAMKIGGLVFGTGAQIGSDKKSSHKWSDDTVMTYRAGNHNVMVCGNNGEDAANSGKVMMKAIN